MAEPLTIESTEAPRYKYAILSHIYDEVPQFDVDTAPEEQISTEVLSDSIHLDLETRFVLATGIILAAIPVVLIGLVVWVNVINNWNFLNWLE